MLISGEMLSDEDYQSLNMDMRLIINRQRIGEVGDIITVSDKDFKLINIDKILVSSAAAYYYRIFGFESPREFIEHWLSKKRCDANSHVYVHYFEALES